MVTFRHEKYVRQAIESVLAQDIDDWEIIVGDDASDDSTIEIVHDLVPDCEWNGRSRLRILPYGEKVGRRANYMRVLAACRGTYTAQLDGDDFLVGPSSLRLRAEFLDARPDFAFVFSSWYETDDDGEPLGLARRVPDGRRRLTYVDFGPGCPCASSAVMHRTRLYGEFPDWYEGAPVGDWPLHVLNALRGDVGFVDEVLAIHRNHSAGVWSGADTMAQLEIALNVQSLFLSKLPPDKAEAMRLPILRFQYAEAKRARRAGDHVRAIRLYRWCLQNEKGVLPNASLRRGLWFSRFRIGSSTKLAEPVG